MKPVLIEHLPVITGGHLKRQWVPTSKVVEDVEFMCISKWDRGFVFFCTGKSLDLRKGAASRINVPFVDELKGLRDSECDRALAQALYCGDGSDEGPPKKARKATKADAVLVQRILELKVPRFGDDGAAADGVYTMRTLFTPCDGGVWIELNEENLNFVRGGVLAGLAVADTGRCWRPFPDRLREKGTAWYSAKTKYVYCCFTQADGTDVVQTFKVQCPADEIAIAVKIDEANAYAAEHHHHNAAEAVDDGDRSPRVDGAEGGG